MYTNCVVILAYIENYTKDYLKELVSSYDYIICADGGQVLAAQNDITPDCVIGDFDSTTVDTHFDCKYITYPPEKDITDAEACVLHALDLSISNITFIGGMGGRLDHTLGALALPLKFIDKGISIEFIDMKNHVRLIKNGSLTLKKDNGYKYFSIIPAFEHASGISIVGAKYPLDNASLDRASTLGVSNEIADDICIVSVKENPLFVIESND